MKRRVLLATVGGVAVGTSVSSFATAGASEDDESDADCEPVEIVVAKSGDEVVRTREVPKAWQEQVEHTRDVQDELHAEYSDATWYVGSGITGGDREICDRNEMAIRIRASDPEAARAELGDERDGVQIEITESDGGFTLDVHIQEDELELDGDSGRGDSGRGDSGDDSTVEDAPGFGSLGALGGLAGVGYLYVRRKKKR